MPKPQIRVAGNYLWSLMHEPRIFNLCVRCLQRHLLICPSISTSIHRSFTCSCLARSKAIGEGGSAYCATVQGWGNGGSPPQTGHVTVKVVLVPGNGTRIGVLPECVVTPPVRQSADGAGIASNPQRAVRGKNRAVSGAGPPPVCGRVDHWVAANAGVVGVGEIPNPADHCGGTQAITSGTIWVICPRNDGCVQFGGWR